MHLCIQTLHLCDNFEDVKTMSLCLVIYATDMLSGLEPVELL